MAGVVLHELRKVYSGGIEAVKGISFDVPDGTFCVLVGPSGCGKSTLLRMIAGIETVTSGEIRIDGRVVNHIEPSERDIAMVFQNYALYPHMSVYDNMAYGLRNRRTPKDEIDRRVKEAARMLAIEQFLSRRPRDLSGGQRQRVAMGRAIVRKPKAFLFDEPLSNLDAKLRGQMRVEIKRLQRSLGVTSIYVTHDQLEAMTLADVLVVMNAGEVEQIGPPLELYARPRTVFVAGFIGAPAMNFVSVRANGSGLEAHGGGLVGGVGVSIPAIGALLGVRPEHLTPVAPGAPRDGDVVMEITVAAVEAVGAETFVYGQLPAGKEIIVRLAGTAPDVGEKLSVAAPPERLHLFDVERGLRIGAGSLALGAAQT
jgi:sn-glycerol 3-phosphate transport system ATP-binding protein